MTRLCALVEMTVFIVIYPDSYSKDRNVPCLAQQDIPIPVAFTSAVSVPKGRTSTGIHQFLVRTYPVIEAKGKVAYCCICTDNNDVKGRLFFRLLLEILYDHWKYRWLLCLELFIMFLFLVFWSLKSAHNIRKKTGNDRLMNQTWELWENLSWHYGGCYPFDNSLISTCWDLHIVFVRSLILFLSDLLKGFFLDIPSVYALSYPRFVSVLFSLDLLNIGHL